MNKQLPPPADNGYGRYHRARRNLVIHIVAVPLFLLGNVVLVLALAQGLWPDALAGLALTLLSLAAQGLGHRVEPSPPVAFSSATDAVWRILLEQWLEFPRFVFSGRWRAAMRRAPDRLRQRQRLTARGR